MKSNSNPSRIFRGLFLTVLLGYSGSALAATNTPATGVMESLTFNGQVDQETANFILKGTLRGGGEEFEPKLVYAMQAVTRLNVEAKAIIQTSEFKARVHQGRLKELTLQLQGEGEVTRVTGSSVQDWGVRQTGEGKRFLVVRPLATQKITNELGFVVETKTTIESLPVTNSPLSFLAADALYFDGFLEVAWPLTIDVKVQQVNGLAPLREDVAPRTQEPPGVTATNRTLKFRLAGTGYSLTLAVSEADSDARRVVFDHFKLEGDLKDPAATFVLTGTALVRYPEGESLRLLAGGAALAVDPGNEFLVFTNGAYALIFRDKGTFPVRIQFHARVNQQDGWKSVEFDLSPSSLCPVVLKGLAQDTQFEFAGAVKPERVQNEFQSFLPANGQVRLRWKEAPKETEGKLFYAVDGLQQMAVGPGLLRQVHVMDFKVAQGELMQLVFQLTGEGEVTRILGEGILTWRLEAAPQKGQRRLVVQLNQPRKDHCQVIIQTQTPLGVFPMKIHPLQLVPVDAIRFGGYVLVVNDGAVKLEVVDPRGLSQISPDLFPKTKELAPYAPAQRTQAFAYRFSGADFDLAVQADHIQPELSVSQMLLYHLGETEASLEAELELDIREAPLRELSLLIPADFTVAQLIAPQLSDYFISPSSDTNQSNLRLAFGQPLLGRQVIQLRLEKNQDFRGNTWRLPPIRAQKIKSVRGYVGITVDTGLRVTAGAMEELAEVAAAFFPRKVNGLQLAYRLRGETWQASVTVERLALSIQADATHLFSISDGITYGSSVLNYLVSGAPVSTLKLAAPTSYAHVEFIGKDVRNWKTNDTGYEVYLHTPIFGAYTLLVTYDQPFNAKSDTVDLTGFRPLEAQSEQGSILVVSEYQFVMKPVEVSSGLLQLDPVEVPPEHRLMFDAPLLAAYQYARRPFALRMQLSPLSQGETVQQVVDRATLKTRVSREGEVVTTARYYLKSKGHTHARFTIASQVRLWEAKVNGVKVVPVADGAETLVPLPPKTDPSSAITVELMLATKFPDKGTIPLATPKVAAPILLSEWTVEPDAGYRLHYRRGNITPVSRSQDISGFAWLARLVTGRWGDTRSTFFFIALGELLLSALFLRWAARPGTYRFSATHWIGTLLGLTALVTGIAYLIGLALYAAGHTLVPASGLTFLAPVQDSGSILEIQVSNLSQRGAGPFLRALWPAVLGLVLWIYVGIKAAGQWWQRLGILFGWGLIAWATLRLPNGGAAFLGTLLAFVLFHVLVPSLRCQMALPRRVKPSAQPPAGAVTALILASVLQWGAGTEVQASAPREAGIDAVLLVAQQIQVKDNVGMAKVQLKWRGEAGQALYFLRAPAVLTSIDYPKNDLQLMDSKIAGQSAYRLTPQKAGEFLIQFEYQIPMSQAEGTNGFWLPTPCGLLNKLDLEVQRLEVDVDSPQAVSVRATWTNRQDLVITRAELVLAPVPNAWIGWKPRARDTRGEKPVYYAELYHLILPSAGVIEGVHEIQVRPAQGQLNEMNFQIPAGLTITDVQAEWVSAWRFDPDGRALRVQFRAPQSRPFVLRIRSQLPAPALPFELAVQVPTVGQAAGQVGMIGVATAADVQLDAAREENASAINLEDFPAALVKDIATQMPGLTLRRAFRYSASGARIQLSVSAVQPDLRAQTQETLSLGEDRTLLAVQLSVAITRAGIFKLSFPLPKDMEVESLSGSALSHWTESAQNNERIITLHLRGRTEGTQNFAITLAGPGLARRNDWEAPRLLVREANKQNGQLVVVPELGLRLHVKERDGVTQLDPEKAGIQQKGVLAFRLLNPQWRLRFETESVEPWILATLLQDITLKEGQMLGAVQVEYQIENAGVKQFRLHVPALAENVRFQGDYISDTIRRTNEVAPSVEWEVKLQRRVVGNYSLRIYYQISAQAMPEPWIVMGLRAVDANLQRGYLALHAGGRLEVQTPQVPAALQRIEWQTVPMTLRQGLKAAESRDTFRIQEPDFTLAVHVARHEVAQLLPARVERAEITSVLSSSGEMLTEVRLAIHPGDKRLLRIKLPARARFWYGFVNQESVWPWRADDQLLLKLERNSDAAQPARVEFFYTCETGSTPPRGFTHQLLGPQFDLPLENITWRVFVPESWNVKDWQSTLQLQSQHLAAAPVRVLVDSYLEAEAARQRAQSQQAESLLQMGNDLLQKGVPQQARKAYQAAYRLSQHDAAFNEDARVQWHNLKMQQALLGLHQRRVAAFGQQDRREVRGLWDPNVGLAPGQQPDYTQQQAQEVLDQNSTEDNAVLVRLADRLVKQQDAAVPKPEAIRAALPEQGKVLTFTGSLQVDAWAPLQVSLDTSKARTTVWRQRVVILAGVLLVLGILAVLARRPTPTGSQ